MTKEVQKWADPAMFAAEPLKANEGPKVYLLWMTPDPLGAIAAMAKMYKGEVVRDLSDVTDGERTEYFEQIKKTKLKAPFEAVKFHFMIEGVTRSFTHQMVRQRTAVYAQESLRFAVKEDMADGVALPPSLAGTKSIEEMDIDFDRSGWFDRLDEKHKMRYRWEVANRQLGSTYMELVNAGMPAEDARGLLPHSITTRLNYVTDLRALLDHAGNRLCVQAQFEWRAVFARIIEAIRNPSIGTDHGWIDGVPFTVDQANGSSRVWRSRDLASMFLPVCYQTGKCEFKANFDRKCKIRDRVDAFEAWSVPSSEWEKGITTEEGKRHSISPVEWIADPGAAR